MTLSELEDQTRAIAKKYLDGGITLREYYHKVLYVYTLNESIIEMQDLDALEFLE